MRWTRRISGTAAMALAVTVALSGQVSADPADNPGSVIEVGPLPDEASVPQASAAHRLIYRSRGPRGPMLSAGAVYLPTGTPPPGGWPIVAYAHGTVGIADHCVFTLRPRDYYLKSVYPALLAAGYAVVISDYVGLGTPGTHPYLDGPSQARSVIDGVRAARATAPELSSRWAVLGQSQGGQTALFTAHSAADDAPELDFRGAAATGAPSNLELLAPLFGPWIPRLPLRNTTAYFAMIVAGLRATAPELDIDGYLTPTGAAVVRVVEENCVADADALVRDIAIGDMLARPLRDPALLEAVRAMLEIPMTGYATPLFVGQGLTDLEVPAPLGAKLIADLTAGGADLRVGIYSGDHLGAASQAFPDVLAFLRGLFDRL
ncbi:lipase family protein [Nocardia sp. NBC_01377]|uniref:lipase family protein n=1 Tax=Nocardia sp. NBC_01377 TaxID=2903595 RepID=UPI0032557574